MSRSSRTDLIIMGRAIGTFDGWDDVGDLVMIYYAFNPCPTLERELPVGDISVDYEKGTFSFYCDDGTLYKAFPAFPLLNKLPTNEMP
jgi:hypothetical protein